LLRDLRQTPLAAPVPGPTGARQRRCLMLPLAASNIPVTPCTLRPCLMARQSSSCTLPMPDGSSCMPCPPMRRRSPRPPRPLRGDGRRDHLHTHVWSGRTQLGTPPCTSKVMPDPPPPPPPPSRSALLLGGAGISEPTVQGGCGLELCVRQLRVCGSQLAVCLVSLFVSGVSLVRVVIICPASTHNALVSSPSLAVLHLST